MTSKAARERRFRQREQQRKRFSLPMHKFLEEKYPKVYQEYKDLYQTLDRNHPFTRDLSKTRTFKIWLESLNQQPTSDILSTLIKETIEQPETSRPSMEEDESDSEQSGNNASEDEIARVQNSDQSSIQPSNQASNEASNNRSEELFKVVETNSQAGARNEANEAVATIVSLHDLVDIMSNVEDQVDVIVNELMQEPANVEDQINDIVNELMQDPAVRDVLSEPEDEGIKLNPLDDICYDIEPFDFNLEVENYDW